MRPADTPHLRPHLRLRLAWRAATALGLAGCAALTSAQTARAASVTEAAGTLPELAELQAAVDGVAPVAERLGLRLELGPLWHAALSARTPLVAARQGDRCLLGYSPYTPGQDYRWLFPVLDPARRAWWLQGLVAHELAHCVLQTGAGLSEAAGRPNPGAEAAAGVQQALPRPPAASQTTAVDEEAWADLAFAAQVRAAAPCADDADALVARLASLRAARAVGDPAHDSSAWLVCAGQGPAREAWLVLTHPAPAGSDHDATAARDRLKAAWSLSPRSGCKGEVAGLGVGHAEPSAIQARLAGR